jgi:hypothetical protein
MRRLLFLVAVAGCTHAGSSGPQWPKATASEHDGGESIAPREGAKSIAAATDKDDGDDEAAPAGEAAPATAGAPAATTEGGAPAAAAPAATDDVIQTEEIVIEIGPDD